MDAAGRVWFRDALHGELARTTVANPFDERGGAMHGSLSEPSSHRLAF